MGEIISQAHAKINLTLDVTGKLENGYHTVKMVMQTLALHDDVIVRSGTCKGIQLESNRSFLPTDSHNLAVRAAMAFFERTGITNDGIHIKLVKRIPVAAGLAGGSSNAAATLCCLNELYDAKLSLEDLCLLGQTLGADVPYCIRGGSMLAEGIGEILTPLPAMPDCYVVVCKPPFAVSTAKIYAKMNGGNLPVRPDTKGMCTALSQGDYAGICHRLFNVMEAVTGKENAAIGEIKNILLECGADGAVMSGSGPSVFGLFSVREKAEKAELLLRSKYEETYLTTILK